MATLYTNRLIIVILAADLAAANTIAAQVHPDAGQTFRVGLSASGNGPATNYWCNWAMLPGEDIDIRGRANALIQTNRVRVYDANTNTPEQVLSTLGLQRIRGPLG